MMTDTIRKEIEIAGRKIHLEVGRFARQANGAVMVTSGDTQVLVTVCGDSEDSDNSFFPLTVDYIEKFYAAGRIPGGYIKREAKPSSQEMITARLIDRSLRPNFPEGFSRNTQVICTVLSYGTKDDPAVLALLGASCALTVSDIPFNAPIAGLRVGMGSAGEYMVFPAAQQTEALDLFLAVKDGAIVMVEASASFLPEDKVLEALKFGYKQAEPMLAVQDELRSSCGKEKSAFTVAEVDAEMQEQIKSKYQSDLATALQVRAKTERKKALSELKKSICTEVAEVDGVIDEAKRKMATRIFGELMSAQVREGILHEKKRIDGRSPEDIRPIVCETGVLKSPHGSSMFTRGETQAIATVTLGSGDDEQRMDTIIAQNSSSRFMLHYNFPPYSVGETKRLIGLSRREMGHGYLAERALQHVIPEARDFGYTIRVVSEVLESNGSSSMASVCAGTMALLHAGVPIKKHVAGIAMGLVCDSDNIVVLTDILGDEDHLGDMDFKVCGDEDGITALQMDIKVDGLSQDTMRLALEQARQARLAILSQLKETIPKPGELSKNAPRIESMKINESKIRDLIGPGGKVIKKLVADSGAKIDIEDNGIVRIISPDFEKAEMAKEMIRTITSDPEVGGIYLGTVKRITEFGAFIEIKTGTEGLCHISQLDDKRVEKVEDVLKMGEKVIVKLTDIDRQGRLRLSRKEAIGQQPTF
ncbi:MAG: polyribonucleotide nucleotidyltransferase [Pseudomonadota bacterium]|nr:polyribonucleotide nucleotidyltransferase [Pseudomonadota bacterium]